MKINMTFILTLMPRCCPRIDKQFSEHHSAREQSSRQLVCLLDEKFYQCQFSSSFLLPVIIHKKILLPADAPDELYQNTV